MIYYIFKNTYFFWVIILLFGLISCRNKSSHENLENNTRIAQKSNKEMPIHNEIVEDIIIASPKDYLHLLQGKAVAIVGNQTSIVKNSNADFTHLVDTLIALKININKAFSPEHGFRGRADAGELVLDSKDTQTGLPIISLHGKNKKPTKEQLKGIEIMIFDIQDVGVRFYTYLSTLHYVMEACAEAGIPLIVIDRPNPNASYIDGPVLETKHKSFLGMHPVPLVYAMTIGEYAQMINGEKWLKDGVQCNITIMPLKHYSYNTNYSLPIRPSPNLPNDKAINLYPSLGLFEGTSINAGRGTEMQFQIFGAPYLNKNTYPFSYTPRPNLGAKFPKHVGKLCNGIDLRTFPALNMINLEWLIHTYNNTPKGQEFFQATFTAHAGTEKLQDQIKTGLSAEDIRNTWRQDLEAFKEIRRNYLLYD